MGIASSMKELTQDIASSHEERLTRIGEIKGGAKQVREEAQDLIKGFQVSRGKKGAQLREYLAQDKASRKSDIKEMLGDARGLITGFQALREKEGAQLRVFLAQGVAERRSDVVAVLGDARQTIRSLKSQRQETGIKLREELVQSRTERKSEVKELTKGAQDLVKGLGKSRQETGKKLRQDLAEGKADRESQVKEMRNEFHKSQAAVRTDINEARTAWQDLARTMQAKRARVEVPPMPEEEEVPIAEEAPDLEAKLLAAVSEHPEGISLAEVAESLGVVPIVLGRAAKKLVDEGKIRKKGRLYTSQIAGE